MKMDPKKLAEAMARARLEFGRGIDDRFEAIRTALTQARQAPDPSHELAELTRLVHRLHGTAGSMGYPKLSLASAAVESFLGGVAERQDPGFDSSFWSDLEARVAALPGARSDDESGS